VFSESLPTKVRPGDKVYVVVDGISYLVVNDDGSELASTNEQPSSNGPISTQCEDSTPPADWSTSLPNVNSNCTNGTLDNNTKLTVPVSQNQLGEKRSVFGDSSGMGKTEAELTESSGVNVSQNTDSRLRTILAENDDEFEHLSSELPKKPAFSDESEFSDQPSAFPPDKPAGATSSKSVGVGNPTAFVNSFLGFIRAGKKGVERPTLPKFVIQPRLPQLRLPTPGTLSTASTTTTKTTAASANTATNTAATPTVRPVSVITPSPGSSPKKQVVTTILRSTSPQKLADPRPAVSSIVEICSTDVDVVTTTATTTTTTTSTTTAVKPSRQPRITKRMTLSNFLSVCLYYC